MAQLGMPLTAEPLDESLHSKALRQKAFLAAYRKTAIITTAAKAVGICRDTHYDWLAESNEYTEQFEAAKKYAAQALEEELFNRAIDGKSDTLLIFALKGAMKEKYRDNLNLSGQVDLNAKRLIGVPESEV